MKNYKFHLDLVVENVDQLKTNKIDYKEFFVVVKMKKLEGYNLKSQQFFSLLYHLYICILN